MNNFPDKLDEIKYLNETCTLDYKEEYYRLSEKFHKLTEENDKLKIALVNIALKL